LVFCRFSAPCAAPTELYTLSLHDALPISAVAQDQRDRPGRLHQWVLLRRPELLGHRWRPPARLSLLPHWAGRRDVRVRPPRLDQDRKSTRLNSSHVKISYAVFCLKKKKNT